MTENRESVFLMTEGEMSTLTTLGLADAVRIKQEAELLARKIQLLSDELRQAPADYRAWQVGHGSGYAAKRRAEVRQFLDVPKSLEELQAEARQYSNDLNRWAAECRGGDTYPSRRAGELSARLFSIANRRE